jgi:hypothetical protein
MGPAVNPDAVSMFSSWAEKQSESETQYPNAIESPITAIRLAWGAFNCEIGLLLIPKEFIVYSTSVLALESGFN